MDTAITVAVLSSAPRHKQQAVFAAEGTPAAITIGYPLNGSFFPPEITPPTFIWRDAVQAATLCRIAITKVGEIDKRCISSNNERCGERCRRAGWFRA